MTDSRAFAWLADRSQHSNRKLRDMVEDVIATGDLRPRPDVGVDRV